MRKLLNIIKDADYIMNEEYFKYNDFSKGQKVRTPMGDGKIIEIETEKEKNKERSLTSHLADYDARVNYQALVEFEDDRTIWFSLFQLTPI
ncbi:hypothetical protein PBI_SCTP2_456 [Salicola phage SCTP-2]|nr:hypothetical protein PBI_SCTP2_456 [Salicola phage SCTP-2]